MENMEQVTLSRIHPDLVELSGQVAEIKMVVEEDFEIADDV